MTAQQIRRTGRLGLVGLVLAVVLTGVAAHLLGRPGAGGATGQTHAPSSRGERAWHYIVIHHSATAEGNAAAFDRYHREVRGWGELGYHFVIGNGAGSGDGQVETGPRWTAQRGGAHCLTRSGRFNARGIGICLVGNFEQTRPTPRQLDSLHRLVGELMDRYAIPPANVLGHREALAADGHSRTTLCAGRHLDMDALRRAVGG